MKLHGVRWGRTLLAVASAAILGASAGSAAADVITDSKGLDEFVAAASEVAQEFDTIPFVVTTAPLGYGTYAGAIPGVITVNETYSNDPALLDKDFSSDVQFGYHSPGCSAQRYLGYHEAAHELDYTHGRRARWAAIHWWENTLWPAAMLSGYSFNWGGQFMPGEALAEAFAAVKCDPAPSIAELELYFILVATQ